MNVPLADLQSEFAHVGADVRAAIERVLVSGRFILGPEVAAFESLVAEACGVRHAIGVSSGTDALLAALLALGVGPGAEVITTPYSFFATVGAIWRVGARPVFADVQPDTYTLAPAAVAARLTSRTRAILPVHLFGLCADVPALRAVADPAGIPLVEDAAQALGARHGGRPAGALGLCGCFSFFPTKNLGACGDAGCIVTDDAELAARLRLLRNHGAVEKHLHPIVGGNFRLDALQAAVLRAKWPQLPEWTRRRRANAAYYDAAFAGLAAAGLRTPPRLPGSEPVYHHYVIAVPAAARDPLRAALAARGIETAVYYPRPLHLQPCLAALGHAAGDFPAAEAAARETLALPVHPGLQAAQREAVVAAVEAFFRA